MENAFHDWLKRELPADARMFVPIGDDAAALAFPADEQLVVAADAIMDGVHFQLAQHGPRMAGRKALAVNLSDMAAMAARPLAVTVTLTLPHENADAIAREAILGVLELAEEFDVVLCGGDTNCWAHPLSISVTVFGAAPRDLIWRRNGGVVGDQLVVTGPLGGSLLGKHLRFIPRVAEALRWRETFRIHAAIDISDGLALDASRLAAASGCGAVFELDGIPISGDAVARAKESGKPALQHALTDGEDFELLLALPDEEAMRFCREIAEARRIGSLIAETGLWSESQGERKSLEPSGYEHS